MDKLNPFERKAFGDQGPQKSRSHTKSGPGRMPYARRRPRKPRMGHAQMAEITRTYAALKP